MAITLQSKEDCDAVVKLLLIGCKINGADPVITLKTYRAAAACDAPYNDVLLAAFDRALFDLEQPITAS